MAVSETQTVSRYGVTLTVVPDQNGAPTFLEPSPSHPGPQPAPGSHDIKIRNRMSQRVRICMQATGAAGIEDQFQTPLNLATVHIGWVEIGPRKGEMTERVALLILDDSAFPSSGENLIQFRVSPAGYTCVFGDPGPTQDIIIP